MMPRRSEFTQSSGPSDAEIIDTALATHTWEFVGGIRQHPGAGLQTTPAVRCVRCGCIVRLETEPGSEIAEMAVPITPVQDDAFTVRPCIGARAARAKLGGWAPPGGWVWRPLPDLPPGVLKLVYQPPDPA